MEDVETESDVPSVAIRQVVEREFPTPAVESIEDVGAGDGQAVDRLESHQVIRTAIESTQELDIVDQVMQQAGLVFDPLI